MKENNIYIYVKRRGLSSKKYKSLTLKNKDNELHKLVVQQKRKKYAVSFASLKNPSSWSNALQSLQTVEYLEFINPQRLHLTVADVSSITSRVLPVISIEGEVSVRSKRIDSESSASTLQFKQKNTKRTWKPWYQFVWQWNSQRKPTFYIWESAKWCI